MGFNYAVLLLTLHCLIAILLKSENQLTHETFEINIQSQNEINVKQLMCIYATIKTFPALADGKRERTNERDEKQIEQRACKTLLI